MPTAHSSNKLLRFASFQETAAPPDSTSPTCSIWTSTLEAHAKLRSPHCSTSLVISSACFPWILELQKGRNFPRKIPALHCVTVAPKWNPVQSTFQQFYLSLSDK